MIYQLSSSELLNYDVGKSGITVDVTLNINKKERVNCEAKADTGSSFCIFKREIGEQLGLNITDGVEQNIGTVTGNFVVYLHEVNLTISNFELYVMVGFAQDESFQRNILGRRGFLEQTILGIADYEGKLYLSLYREE